MPRFVCIVKVLAEFFAGDIRKCAWDFGSLATHLQQQFGFGVNAGIDLLECCAAHFPDEVQAIREFDGVSHVWPCGCVVFCKATGKGNGIDSRSNKAAPARRCGNGGC